MMEEISDIPKCGECGREFGSAEALSEHMECHNLLGRPFKCSQCNYRAESQNRLDLHRHKHSRQCFQCDLCLKTFKWKANLTSHMKLHIGEGLHLCNICGKKCTTPSILERHLDSHAQILQYKCKVCQREFKHKQNYNQHLKMHTGKGLHKCQICKKKFTSSSILKNHMDTHSRKPNYACDICLKPFKTRLMLRHHKRLHTKDKVSVCSFCGKIFAIPSKLAVHLQTHSTEPQFECELCGIKYKHQRALMRHKQVRHNAAATHDCKLCGKKFPSPSTLQYHMDSHATKEQYTCKTCGEKFKRIRALRYHMKVHTGTGVLKCQECGKTYFTPSGLATHMESHITEYNFPCDTCGRHFKHERALKKHVESTHQYDGVSHSCETCGRSYKHLAMLNQHKKIHIGKNLHTCKQCGRVFVKKSEYERHLDSHSTEPQYECHVCNKKYKHKNDLRVHLKIHTDFAIKCDVCGKLFATKQQLGFHLVVHSDIMTYKCQTCDMGFKYESSLNKHLKTHSYVKQYKSNGRKNTMPTKNRGWKKYFEMRKVQNDDAQQPTGGTQGKQGRHGKRKKEKHMQILDCWECARIHPVKIDKRTCRMLHSKELSLKLVNVESVLLGNAAENDGAVVKVVSHPLIDQASPFRIDVGGIRQLKAAAAEDRTPGSEEDEEEEEWCSEEEDEDRSLGRGEGEEEAGKSESNGSVSDIELMKRDESVSRVATKRKANVSDDKMSTSNKRSALSKLTPKYPGNKRKAIKGRKTELSTKRIAVKAFKTYKSDISHAKNKNIPKVHKSVSEEVVGGKLKSKAKKETSVYSFTDEGQDNMMEVKQERESHVVKVTVSDMVTQVTQKTPRKLRKARQTPQDTISETSNTNELGHQSSSLAEAECSVQGEESIGRRSRSQKQSVEKDVAKVVNDLVLTVARPVTRSMSTGREPQSTLTEKVSETDAISDKPPERSTALEAVDYEARSPQQPLDLSMPKCGESPSATRFYSIDQPQDLRISKAQKKVRDEESPDSMGALSNGSQVTEIGQSQSDSMTGESQATIIYQDAEREEPIIRNLQGDTCDLCNKEARMSSTGQGEDVGQGHEEHIIITESDNLVVLKTEPIWEGSPDGCFLNVSSSHTYRVSNKCPHIGTILIPGQGHHHEGQGEVQLTEEESCCHHTIQQDNCDETMATASQISAVSASHQPMEEECTSHGSCTHVIATQAVIGVVSTCIHQTHH